MLADESMTSTSAAAVAERVTQGRERILAELHKVIVGQDEVLDLVLTALFTGGHCLITGVPGLAKTLLIKTLAAVLHLTDRSHLSDRGGCGPVLGAIGGRYRHALGRGRHGSRRGGAGGRG